jgi:molybdate transport system substrate-binding protein
MSEERWSRQWNIGVRVWVERHGETVLGEGRADLLDAIGKHRSITAAAKAIGMSYRRAWNLVQEINEAAGQPLVEAAVGGVRGGGALLTEHGALAVDVYRKLRSSLEQHAARALRDAVASGASGDAEPCVHLAAAISLQEALGQVLSAFALHRPLVRVRAVYGASNELAAHLLAGAPGDLFIAAERIQIDELETAGLIEPGTRRVVAFNRLVAIGRAEASQVKTLHRLAGDAVKRLALADPACPLGRCSKAYLEAAGMYERLLPKALHVDSSRAVLSAVASGAASAGLAFASDAQQSRDYGILFRVPRAKAETEYVAAILAGGRRRDEARELLEFLETPRAARCLRRFGFRPAAGR